MSETLLSPGEQNSFVKFHEKKKKKKTLLASILIKQHASYSCVCMCRANETFTLYAFRRKESATKVKMYYNFAWSYSFGLCFGYFFPLRSLLIVRVKIWVIDKVAFW